MMKQISRLLVIAALPLASNMAQAAPEPGQVFFDCDTKEGHSTEMALNLRDDQKIVTGTISVHQLYADPQWFPTALVELASESAAVGIRLKIGRIERGAVAQERKVSIVFHRTVKGEQPVEVELGSVPVGKDMPFSIEIRAKDIFLRLGDFSRTAPLALGRTHKLRLGCSTGQFTFTDIFPH